MICFQFCYNFAFNFNPRRYMMAPAAAQLGAALEAGAYTRPLFSST
jgi:hypothetical protein